MGKNKIAVWLENWLTSGFTIKKMSQVLVVLLAICLGVWWWPKLVGQGVAPVLLLINQYPLTETEKQLFKQANPYGFLLGIPIHSNMSPAQLRRELKEVLGRNDFLFFIDQEGGLVNRIKHFDPSFKAPAPAYFGKMAKRDMPAAEKAVYEYGLRTGKKLKELSIDVVFAPLAEAAAGEDTYTRSRYFSDDPTVAKKLADLYAQGLAAGGVIPCYKHFFGSATPTDPHESEQYIPTSLSEIRAKALPAFEYANRWPFLMTAHAFYPALDDKRISTYSPAFYRFAREEIPFEGIIVTDALNMEAADGAKAEGIAWRMNKALAAGADIVIPFFNIDAENEWILEQISYIPSKYARRLQRKIKMLQKKGKYLAVGTSSAH